MPDSYSLHLRGVALSIDSAATPLVTAEGDTIRIKGLDRDGAYRLTSFTVENGGEATIITPTVAAIAPGCTFTISTGPLMEPPEHARTVRADMGTVTWWEVRDAE